MYLVMFYFRWMMIIICNPIYLALWVFFSLGPLIYIFKKTSYLKVTPELAKRYDAFFRTDLEKRKSIFVYLINLFTFLPRYIIAWLCVMIACSIIVLIMVGSDAARPLDAWRYNLVCLTIKPFVRLHLWMSGVIKINYQKRKDVCYK
jgi:hypothetical protein